MSERALMERPALLREAHRGRGAAKSAEFKGVSYAPDAGTEDGHFEGDREAKSARRTHATSDHSRECLDNRLRHGLDGRLLSWTKHLVAYVDVDDTLRPLLRLETDPDVRGRRARPPAP